MGNDHGKKLLTVYPRRCSLSGAVKQLTDYGCFVEIERPVVEGLVTFSEMIGLTKIVHHLKWVNTWWCLWSMVLGKIDTNVVVFRLAWSSASITLGNLSLKSQRKQGDKMSGKINVQLLMLGIFIGLTGGIDGLVTYLTFHGIKTGEDAGPWLK